MSPIRSLRLTDDDNPSAAEAPLPGELSSDPSLFEVAEQWALGQFFLRHCTRGRVAARPAGEDGRSPTRRAGGPGSPRGTGQPHSPPPPPPPPTPLRASGRKTAGAPPLAAAVHDPPLHLAVRWQMSSRLDRRHARSGVHFLGPLPISGRSVVQLETPSRLHVTHDFSTEPTSIGAPNRFPPGRSALARGCLADLSGCPRSLLPLSVQCQWIWASSTHCLSRSTSRSRCPGHRRRSPADSLPRSPRPGPRGLYRLQRPSLRQQGGCHRPHLPSCSGLVCSSSTRPTVGSAGGASGCPLSGRERCHGSGSSCASRRPASTRPRDTSSGSGLEGRRTPGGCWESPSPSRWSCRPSRTTAGTQMPPEEL